MEQAEGVKRGTQVIEKPVHLVCGGLEKRVVFQQAVLPVLKTMCQQLNCDIKDYVQRLVTIMFGGRESGREDEAQVGHYTQLVMSAPQLPALSTVFPQHLIRGGFQQY